jgi:hypothetical protein
VHLVGRNAAEDFESTLVEFNGEPEHHVAHQVVVNLAVIEHHQPAAGGFGG